MIPHLLIMAARSALDSVILRGERLRAPDPEALPEAARRHVAVYVTLWRWPQGDPRASHGFFRPTGPLLNAVLAAVHGCVAHETIFPRPRPDELDQLTIRIHLLGTWQPITAMDPRPLPPNHALILTYPGHSAFFLPESLRLAGWDLPEAISQLCLKAGLPGNMWRDPDVAFHQVPITTLGERSPRGPVFTFSAH